MKWTLIGVLCISLAIVHGKDEEHVLTINGEDEFNKAVKDSEFLVAEFYAPWCGHCKNLAPEYEKAAKTLKEKDSKVVLAKVTKCIKQPSFTMACVTHTVCLNRCLITSSSVCMLY